MRVSVSVLVLAFIAGSARAGDLPAPVARIEPGTRLDCDALPEHTHLVFRTRPRVTSGAVDRLPKAVAHALHNLTTLVLVESEPDPDRPGRYRRGRFSIGIGWIVNGVDVVVTKSSAAALELHLGFYEKRVLNEREKDMSGAVTPGFTSTMVIFDFPGVHARDEGRVPITLRYAALIDPATGRVDTLHWVLDPTPAGLRFFGNTMQRWRQGHQMEWPMDVDGSRFLFGNPLPDAFACTKLPHGTPIEATDEFKTVAAAKAYEGDACRDLERRLRALLK